MDERERPSLLGEAGLFGRRGPRFNQRQAWTLHGSGQELGDRLPSLIGQELAPAKLWRRQRADHYDRLAIA